MRFELDNDQLPAKIYRRILLLTEMWPGERAAPGSLLIRFHTADEHKTPFFWAGESSFLASFRETIGRERSIYCMSGLYGTLTSSQENVRALGRYYAREILKIQPQGPYLLGGWCNAGFVSYEVAKLLEAEGHEVKMMILLDRDVSEQNLVLRLARRLYRASEAFDHRRQQLITSPLICIKEFLLSKRDELLRLSAEIIHKLGVRKTPPLETVPEYYLHEYPRNIQLIFVKWGLIGFFRFEYFQRYWKKKVLGEITIHIIEGKKHREPNWNKIADIINDHFKQANV